MKFEGDQDFAQEPTVLWKKLRSAAFLVECIPDAAIEGQPTAEQANCTVRPGLSFIRGTLDVNVKILEAVEPTLIKIGLVSKGIGSGSDAEATLNLAPHEKGSRVHWQGEIKSMSGLMKMVPSGLIKGAAQKVIEDLLNSVRQKLEVGNSE
jgi:carbon monoxide dehydrogenase subunit G